MQKKKFFFSQEFPLSFDIVIFFFFFCIIDIYYENYL